MSRAVWLLGITNIKKDDAKNTSTFLIHWPDNAKRSNKDRNSTMGKTDLPRHGFLFEIQRLSMQKEIR